mmetsp:Transcript_14252/g.27759  ORF Transcript_14252/g.27759 Transcript_14252/m.27759 type:complete len:238 (-) Transcript_14252:7532-8245(-)
MGCQDSLCFVLKPTLVLFVDELVTHDTLNFVVPQLNNRMVFLCNFCWRKQYTLEHAGEITHVKDIVKLAGSGQHFCFAFVPELNSSTSESFNIFFGGRARQFSPQHRSINVINGGLRWRSHVEDKEVALETSGDIITPTSGVAHCSDESNVFDCHALTTLVFLEEVNASFFDHLTDNFQSRLVTPVVDFRHRDVIQENGHPATTRRGIRFTLTFFDISLNARLVHTSRSGRREVDLF